jgi:hypothetical protein
MSENERFARSRGIQVTAQGSQRRAISGWYRRGYRVRPKVNNRHILALEVEEHARSKHK